MPVTADELDHLYGLPMDEFTKARNALAKSSGDKSIGKLKKPSAAAWALNQAARKSKGDVGRFLHSAATVRSKPTRDALDELRTAESDVRRAALAALGDRGDTQLGAVNSLMAAAAADEDIAEALRAGRLTGDEESESTGFTGAVAPGTSKAKKPKPPPKDEVRDARERKATKELREREAARKKAEEAAAEAKEADREADRLEREAADAEDKAAKARKLADTARAKADKAKARAEEVREAAKAKGRA